MQDQFCAGECADDSSDPEWDYMGCLEECGKDSDATARAIAEALASIDLTNHVACTSNFDAIGSAFVREFKHEVRRAVCC